MDKEHPIRAVGGCAFRAVRLGLGLAFLPIIMISENDRHNDKDNFKKFKGMGMEIIPMLRGLLGAFILGVVGQTAEVAMPGSKELMLPFIAGYLTFAAGDTALSTIYNIGYHLPESK